MRPVNIAQWHQYSTNMWKVLGLIITGGENKLFECVCMYTKYFQDRKSVV